jgi:hypothetical protein
MSTLKLKNFFFSFIKSLFKNEKSEHFIFLKFNNELIMKIFQNLFFQEILLFNFGKKLDEDMLVNLKFFKNIKKKLSKNFFFSSFYKRKELPFKLILFKNFDNIPHRIQESFKVVIEKKTKNFKFLLFYKNYDKISDSMKSKCIFFEEFYMFEKPSIEFKNRFKIYEKKNVKRKFRKIFFFKNKNSSNNISFESESEKKKFLLLKLFFNKNNHFPNEFFFFFLRFLEKKTLNFYFIEKFFFLEKKILKIRLKVYFIIFLLK